MQKWQCIKQSVFIKCTSGTGSLHILKFKKIVFKVLLKGFKLALVTRCFSVLYLYINEISKIHYNLLALKNILLFFLYSPVNIAFDLEEIEINNKYVF